MTAGGKTLLLFDSTLAPQQTKSVLSMEPRQRNTNMKLLIETYYGRVAGLRESRQLFERESRDSLTS